MTIANHRGDKREPPRHVPSRVRPNRRIQSWMIVALIALVCRVLPTTLVLGDVPRLFIAPDSYEYDRLAVNLVDGRGYSQALTVPYVPDVRRTPVYPFALAAIYSITGHEPQIAIVANALLGVVVCSLTAALGSRVFGRGVGVLAGIFLATDATSIFYSLTLMTETLFTLFLVLCALKVVAYVYGETESAIVNAAWAGILCGIAILTRPIGLFLPLFLAPALVVLRRAPIERIRLTAVGIFTIVALLFPAAWTLRNYLTVGLAQPTSLIAVNAYYYRAAPLEASQLGIPASEDEENGAAQSASEITVSEQRPATLIKMEREATQIILADPLGYAALHVAGIRRMLGPDRDILPRIVSGQTRSEVWKTVGQPVTIGETIQLLALYVLSIVAIVGSIKRPSIRPAIVLLLTFVLYFVAISGPEAYARFRVPIMPFVAILAAHGAQLVWESFNRFRVDRTRFSSSRTYRGDRAIG